MSHRQSNRDFRKDYLPPSYVNILKRVTINKSPWIKLERIFYKDPRSLEDTLPESCDHFKTYMCDEHGSPLNLSKNIRYWDVFSRNTHPNQNNVNSATTFALCYKKGTLFVKQQLLDGDFYSFYVSVVEQFRPSVNANTLEFPSGICDRDEQIGECALRELKEETGLTGVVINNSPNLPTSVLGNDNTCLVTVLVDLDLEVNHNPVQSLEPTEHIVSHLFPLSNLLQNLEVYCSKTGCTIADNLYFFCYALSLLPFEVVLPHMVTMVKTSR